MLEEGDRVRFPSRTDPNGWEFGEVHMIDLDGVHISVDTGGMALKAVKDVTVIESA